MTYLKNSKVVVFKSKGGDHFFVEIINNPKKNLSANDRESIVNTIKEITKDCWGNPGELAYKWFDLADVLVVARHNDSVEGFATGCFVENNLVNLILTAVRKSAQNSGLGKFLNRMILKKAGRKYLNFSPLYLVFRTPNPTLYGFTSKRINLFPSINRDEPTKRELEILNKIVNLYTPNAKFDEKTFAVYGALKPYSELVYQKDAIPWAKDKKINELFERNLHLSQREGNVMIVIGKIPFLYKMFLALT